MEEKIHEAVRYASSSNGLENNKLTNEELNQIIRDIQSGKTDESFLFTVARLVKQYNGEEFIEEENGLCQELKMKF